MRRPGSSAAHRDALARPELTSSWPLNRPSSSARPALRNGVEMGATNMPAGVAPLGEHSERCIEAPTEGSQGVQHGPSTRPGTETTSGEPVTSEGRRASVSTFYEMPSRASWRCWYLSSPASTASVQTSREKSDEGTAGRHGSAVVGWVPPLSGYPVIACRRHGSPGRRRSRSPSRTCQCRNPGQGRAGVARRRWWLGSPPP